jgi:hypothetical protein
MDCVSETFIFSLLNKKSFSKEESKGIKGCKGGRGRGCQSPQKS